MKLNLGSGRRKQDGWVNVDNDPTSEPDVLHSLEDLPWPFEDSVAEEVLMSHVLEHVGQKPDDFLAIMKELYRVCRDGAEVRVIVPHPRHDNFLADPTHVRPISVMTLQLFDQELNKQWIERDGANSPFGLALGVDFKMTKQTYNLDPKVGEQHKAGKLTDAQVRQMMHTGYNVVSSIDMTLQVRKPGFAERASQSSV